MPSESSRQETAARSISSRPGLLLTMVLLAIAVTYSASPLGDFVWDDTTLIVEQGNVRELQPLSTYFDRMFFGGPAGAPTRTFYRPLITLSFALDWKLWGGSPLGFHLTNLLLHLACAALVFGISRRWGARPLAASFAASAFGLLPRLTEAVAWISGRTDLLASFFVLAAVAIHLPAVQGESRVSGTTRRWASALLLLLGLLSKEVAAAGVAALLAFESAEAIRQKPGKRGWLARVSPLVTAVGVYGALRTIAELAARAPSRSPVLDPGTRILVALEALGSYVWALIDLLRPRTQIGSIFVRSLPMVVLGAAAVVGLVVLVWKLRSRKLLSGQAAGLFSLAFVPIALVLHLLPIPLQVAAADRFLYLPAAALAIGAAVAAGAIATRWTRLGGFAAAVLLPAMATATYLRTLDWQDEVSLWSEAVLHAPAGNSLPFVQLGIALSRADRPEEALPFLETAEAIDEDLAAMGLADSSGTGSREARAFALAAMGRLPEALAIFEGMAAARPTDPTYRYNCAAIRAMSLDFAGASRELEGVLARFPDYRDAAGFLVSLRGLEDRWRELPPDPAGDEAQVAMERASIFAALGRGRDAAGIWRKVAESGSASPELRHEASRLLSALATTR